MPIAMLSTSLLTNPQKYGRFNALDTPQPTKPGMVLMKATSIDYNGTSATLGENGQVTFNAVTSLSLNGCFSADFDNYVVSVRLNASAPLVVEFRLRASGSDNSTASSYTRQVLQVDNTSVSASRSTGDKGRLNAAYGTQRAGFDWHVYGPYLTQPTATRSITVSDASSAYIEEYACTHNQSTSYDGFTFIPSSGNITGALTVMGVRS